MARTARKRMGSEGRSWLSRQRQWFRDSGGIDGADEGFAPLRVVWICALWAIVHSALASKQAKGLARRIAGPRYRDGVPDSPSTPSRACRLCGRRCGSRGCPTESSTA